MKTVPWIAITLLSLPTVHAADAERIRQLEERAVAARAERQMQYLERLDAQLSAEEPQARRMAANQLDRLALSDQERIAIFGDELSNADDVVRRYALRALAGLPEMQSRVVESAVAMLRDEDAEWFLQAEAARVLGEDAGAASERVLLEVLQAAETRPSVQRGVIAALGQRGTSTTIPTLQKTLDHPLLSVAYAAHLALAEMNAQSESRKDDRSDDPFARLDALHRIAERDALHASDGNVLVQALEDSEPYVQREAVRTLHRLGPEHAPLAGELGQALADATPRSARALAAGLRRIGPPAAPAVPALVEAVRAITPEDDPHLANALLAALREIGTDAGGVGDALVAALQSNSALLTGRSSFWRAILRSHLFVTLGATGNAALAEREILDALRGDDPYAKAGAARAIGTLGEAGRFAVEPLTAIIQADAPDRYMMLDHLRMTTVKAEAVKALAGIGPAARDALPTLRELLNVNEGMPPPSSMIETAIRSIDR